MVQTPPPPLAKKVTVGDDEWVISSNNEFRNLLDILAIKWICQEGRNIIGYESLVNGGTYTLGPPRQIQQQPVS